MDLFRIKPGYHSTQETIYGSIKRSEFYGFVLGYAVGTIFRGVFNLKDSTLAVIFAAIGVVIGIWVDRKYYVVKDEPAEETEGTEGTVVSATEAEQKKAPSADLNLEGASTQETLKKMFERNADKDEL